MNGTRSPPTNSRIVDRHIKCVLLFLSANKKSQIRNFRRNRKTTATYFSVINPVRCTKKKHLQEVLNPPWANFYFHFLQHFDHHFPLEIYLHGISHWICDANNHRKWCQNDFKSGYEAFAAVCCHGWLVGDGGSVTINMPQPPSCIIIVHLYLHPNRTNNPGFVVFRLRLLFAASYGLKTLQFLVK